MKPLDLKSLIKSAKDFCIQENKTSRPELFGVTDGKAIGTFIEHEFQNYLAQRYDLKAGSSAMGLDLPSVNCDIKTTSITQPQSSCPFKDSKQKIYGLGYHLLVFVYDKHDDVENKTGHLEFVSCTFIDKSLTADYQTTKGIRDIIGRKGNKDDIVAYLLDRNIPADEVTLWNIADDLLKNPPQIGYLTISNALQWRLQYGRIVNLSEEIDGITPVIKYGNK
ncbi:MAG: restriction endonuclease [bacterium]|nr:restriction endonuclease [Candidatus Minthenecus merdequi]